jgi:hypothetical protein
MISTRLSAENLCSEDIADIDFLKAHNRQLTIKLETAQRQVVKLQQQIEQLLKRL